ncbi:hypothetical protein [Agromyces sp. NBRC 114283]|uniref:hypothetical protein n=1 Tax=Agromyces sp. NBRC 114283 TaxID=2994521 RepID=UPI002557B2DC|nr:hypothetical protein [Agromyces sp. NBRC 114283]
MPQPEPPRWHPLLATDEREPGTWYLVDTSGRDYGRIRLVEISGERGYEAHVKPLDGPVRLVGHFTSLRASCERVHRAYVASHGSRGPIGWSAPPATPGTTNAPPPTRR